jgi:macrolide transport system ATP-binding/permease protein
MRRLRAWFSRLGEVFRKRRREQELSAEIESHLQLHIDENLRAGIPQVQARREALMKLGGIEQTKENYRERRGLPLLETLFQDARYAARGRIPDSRPSPCSHSRLALALTRRSSAW